MAEIISPFDFNKVHTPIIIDVSGQPCRPLMTALPGMLAYVPKIIDCVGKDVQVTLQTAIGDIRKLGPSLTTNYLKIASEMIEEEVVDEQKERNRIKSLASGRKFNKQFSNYEFNNKTVGSFSSAEASTNFKVIRKNMNDVLGEDLFPQRNTSSTGLDLGTIQNINFVQRRSYTENVGRQVNYKRFDTTKGYTTLWLDVPSRQSLPGNAPNMCALSLAHVIIDEAKPFRDQLRAGTAPKKANGEIRSGISRSLSEHMARRNAIAGQIGANIVNTPYDEECHDLIKYLLKISSLMDAPIESLPQIPNFCDMMATMVHLMIYYHHTKEMVPVFLVRNGVVKKVAMTPLMAYILRMCYSRLGNSESQISISYNDPATISCMTGNFHLSGNEYPTMSTKAALLRKALENPSLFLSCNSFPKTPRRSETIDDVQKEVLTCRNVDDVKYKFATMDDFNKKVDEWINGLEDSSIPVDNDKMNNEIQRLENNQQEKYDELTSETTWVARDANWVHLIEKINIWTAKNLLTPTAMKDIDPKESKHFKFDTTTTIKGIFASSETKFDVNQDHAGEILQKINEVKTYKLDSETVRERFLNRKKAQEQDAKEMQVRCATALAINKNKRKYTMIGNTSAFFQMVGNKFLGSNLIADDGEDSVPNDKLSSTPRVTYCGSRDGSTVIAHSDEFKRQFENIGQDPEAKKRASIYGKIKPMVMIGRAGEDDTLKTTMITHLTLGVNNPGGRPVDPAMETA